jgi:hypothetical protein
MLADGGVGARVADAAVKRRRSLEVGEHQRHLVDLNVVARPQRLGAEQVAERLQRRRLVRGERFGCPCARFDHHGAFGRPVVA